MRLFILSFKIYCTFYCDEAGIFRCFCFIWKLWMRWGRCQLCFPNLPTASSNLHISKLSIFTPSAFNHSHVFSEFCFNITAKFIHLRNQWTTLTIKVLVEFEFPLTFRAYSTIWLTKMKCVATIMESHIALKSCSLHASVSELSQVLRTVRIS